MAVAPTLTSRPHWTIDGPLCVALGAAGGALTGAVFENVVIVMSGFSGEPVEGFRSAYLYALSFGGFYGSVIGAALTLLCYALIRRMTLRALCVYGLLGSWAGAISGLVTFIVLVQSSDFHGSPEILVSCAASTGYVVALVAARAQRKKMESQAIG